MAMVPAVAWAAAAATAAGAGVAALTRPKAPSPPPVPNSNDAANAAQQQADALRQRRGVLSNIYVGSQSTPAVSGKTTLGT